MQDIEEGYAHELAIVIPAPMPWPFPGYELALMASERAWDMQTELSITLLTPERMALEVFGDHVSREVALLLAERHIELVTSAYCEVSQSQQVVVHPGGRVVHAGRVVALPRLLGPAFDGLPADGGGFLAVDEYGRVRASTACGRPAMPPMFRSSSVASPPSWPTWLRGRSPSKPDSRRDRSRLLPTWRVC